MSNEPQYVQYTSVIGSDLDRDGMYLEVSGSSAGNDVLLEIFYSDQTKEMTLNVFAKDVPLDVVEYAIARAKKRLPPAEKPR